MLLRWARGVRKNGLSVSLRGSMVALSVVMVVVTGSITASVSIVTSNDAIEKTKSAGEEGLRKCFASGSANMESVTGILLRRISEELATSIRYRKFMGSSLSLYLSRMAQEGPPTGMRVYDWTNIILRPELAHMSLLDSALTSQVGIVMPYYGTEKGVQLAERDVLIFQNRGPLHGGKDMVAVFERLRQDERSNPETAVGTPDFSNGGRITDAACNFSLIFDRPSEEGCGRCTYPSATLTLRLSQPWAYRALSQNQTPQAVYTEYVVEPPAGGITLLSVTTWVHHGRRGLVFVASSLELISNELRKVVQAAPPNTRGYAATMLDQRLVLLGTSHGDASTARTYSTGYPTGFLGEMKGAGILPVENATDTVIQSHGKFLRNDLHRLTAGTWKDPESGNLYTVHPERTSGAENQGMVIVLLVPQDSLVRPLLEENERVKLEIEEKEEEVGLERRRAMGILLCVWVTTGLVLALISTGIILRITDSLGELQTKMVRVAFMSLEGIDSDDTQQLSRFTEVYTMQKAFLRMVANLKVYRSYMPQAVLHPQSEGEWDPTRDDVSPSVGEPSPTKMVPHVAYQQDTSQSNNSYYNPAQRFEKDWVQRLEVTGMKLKLRKATVVVVEFGSSKPGDRTSERFITSILAIIRNHGGIVLSFTPVQVLATWNTHSSVVRHCLTACKCAVEISDSLVYQHFSGRWGVAIGTGTVLCGILGDEVSRSPVCIGEPVTFAINVASLAIKLETRILVGEQVVDAVRRIMCARIVDMVRIDTLEGSSHTGCFVYELIGYTPTDAQLKYKEYTRAFIAISDGRFSDARTILEAYLSPECNDYQAYRVLRLMVYALEKGVSFGGKKQAYLRRFQGWDDYEANAFSVPLPDGIKDLRPEAPHVHDPPRSPHGSLDEEKLANEIREALEQGDPDAARQNPLSRPPVTAPQAMQTVSNLQKGPVTLSTVASSSFDAFEEELPPKEFVDRNQSTWYRSEKQLGAGGFGTVWVGMSDTGELVALKALPIKEEAAEVESLCKEVGMLSRLRNEHLVGYCSSAVAGRHVIIAMELLPGGSLAGLLQHFGRIAPATVARYAKDMLRGLRFLHDEGIVHRDFKPGNVLLHIDGTCKLADFGASEHVERLKGVKHTCGTPMYMAPEACRGRAVAASDVWSFGITVAEMLMGKLPYEIDVSRDFEYRAFLARVEAGLEVPTFASLSDEARALCADSTKHEASDRPTASKLLYYPFLVGP